MAPRYRTLAPWLLLPVVGVIWCLVVWFSWAESPGLSLYRGAPTVSQRRMGMALQYVQSGFDSLSSSSESFFSNATLSSQADAPSAKTDAPSGDQSHASGQTNWVRPSRDAGWTQDEPKSDSSTKVQTNWVRPSRDAGWTQDETKGDNSTKAVPKAAPKAVPRRKAAASLPVFLSGPQLGGNASARPIPQVLPRPPPRVYAPPPPMGENASARAILAVYGVSNRARRCTEQSHKEHVKEVLEGMGYHVETYVFESVPVEIDGVKWTHTACSYPHDICETRTIDEIDGENLSRCRDIDCRYRGYRPRDSRNAMRQLYNEYRVGLFLRARINVSEVAFVVAQDIWLPKRMDPKDIQLAAARKDFVFTSTNFDGHMGVTNGLYMGSPESLSILMTRYEYEVMLIDRNVSAYDRPLAYERQLSAAFVANNITRKFLKGYTEKFYSFAKVRYTGRHFSPNVNLSSYVWHCLQDAKANLTKTRRKV